MNASSMKQSFLFGLVTGHKNPYNPELDTVIFKLYSVSDIWNSYLDVVALVLCLKKP